MYMYSCSILKVFLQYVYKSLLLYLSHALVGKSNPHAEPPIHPTIALASWVELLLSLYPPDLLRDRIVLLISELPQRRDIFAHEPTTRPAYLLVVFRGRLQRLLPPLNALQRRGQEFGEIRASGVPVPEVGSRDERARHESVDDAD